MCYHDENFIIDRRERQSLSKTALEDVRKGINPVGCMGRGQLGALMNKESIQFKKDKGSQNLGRGRGGNSLFTLITNFNSY